MTEGSPGFFKSVFDRVRQVTYRQAPFHALFEMFQKVLESDNRALEIITDMGEKLGGDYLFDIQYIKDAYSKLSAALSVSVRNFDLLTRGKYSLLDEVYKRIDKQIKNTIYDLPLTYGKRVLFYEDITWDMRRDVGGKNAGLSDLKNILKVNVPRGFAVTTYAFDEFMQYNRLNEKIDALGKEAGIAEAELNGLRAMIH